MSEEKIILTPEEQLTVCNMNSTGTPLKEAIAAIKARREGKATAPTKEGKKKPTSKEKKEALAKEIEALNGEVPATNSSVAKFEEALTAAKATAKATAKKEAAEKEAAEKEAAEKEVKDLM